MPRDMIRRVTLLARLRTLLALCLAFVLGGLTTMVLPGFSRWRDVRQSREPVHAMPEGVRAAGSGMVARISGAEGSVNVATATYFHDRQSCAFLYGGVQFDDGRRRVESSLAAVRDVTAGEGGSTVFVGAVQVQVQEDGSTATAAAMWSGPDGHVLRGRPVRLERAGSLLIGNTVEYRSDELVLPDGAWVRFEGVEMPGGTHTVRVESSRASADPAAGRWRFEGRARAWNETDLLTSQVLELEPDRMAASGDVYLTAEQSQGRLDVRADRMDWSRSVGRVTFRGGVEAAVHGRTMSCRRLDVDLVAGQVTELQCTGDEVEVHDRAAGYHVVEAARFSWDVRGFVEVDGCPARLSRANGDQLVADVIRHDLETTVTVARSGPVASDAGEV